MRRARTSRFRATGFTGQFQPRWMPWFRPSRRRWHRACAGRYEIPCRCCAFMARARVGRSRCRGLMVFHRIAGKGVKRLGDGVLVVAFVRLEPPRREQELEHRGRHLEHPGAIADTAAPIALPGGTARWCNAVSYWLIKHYSSGMRPLPPIYSVRQVGDRWWIEAPSEHPHQRELDCRPLYTTSHLLLESREERVRVRGTGVSPRQRFRFPQATVTVSPRQRLSGLPQQSHPDRSAGSLFDPDEVGSL